jgi:hypothetical protein
VAPRSPVQLVLFHVNPTEGVSFVVSPHVVFGSGRCVDRVDVATALILVIAPRFWFVALIDFAIHITIDRAKGLCASTFGVTLESGHPWFWTLIGVDQALHHLTGFGLSIFMAANG